MHKAYFKINQRWLNYQSKLFQLVVWNLPLGLSVDVPDYVKSRCWSWWNGAIAVVCRGQSDVPGSGNLANALE